MDDETLRLLWLLLARLERISTDSLWAHRASGVRGALLRITDGIDNGCPTEDLEMKRLLLAGFRILEDAAREKSRQRIP
jgi:hypothetical protein